MVRQSITYVLLYFVLSVISKREVSKHIENRLGLYVLVNQLVQLKLFELGKN